MWSYAGRLALYGVWMALTVGLVAIEGILRGPESRYGEISVIELSETAFLLLTAGFFLAAARVSDRWRALCLSFTVAATMAAVREQDAYLDRYVFNGTWQCIVGALAVWLTVYLRRHGRGLASQVVSFAESRGAGLLAAGFLIVFVFSRLLGARAFWMRVMGDGYQGVVKNIAEEGTELLGYSLLTAAAVETWIHLRRRVRAGGA